MKDKPCEAEPNAPTEVVESSDEADGSVHDDGDTNNGIHKMR